MVRNLELKMSFTEKGRRGYSVPKHSPFSQTISHITVSDVKFDTLKTSAIFYFLPANAFLTIGISLERIPVSLLRNTDTKSFLTSPF